MPSETYRSKLRIFFSVDIVGSTAYKNQHAENSVQPWLPFFKDFYTQFPIVYRRHISDEKTVANFEGDLPIPDLWKSLGDELLFQTELKDHRHVSILVSAFKGAIEKYNQDISHSPLRLKGTAWLAGFPVINAEISFEQQYDFIGPSIDIGFRLTKFATEQQLVISIDLAYMLLKKVDNLEFVYDGKHQLKGVLNNKPYPVIWIKMNYPNADPFEDKIIPKTDRDNLFKFCKNFIENAEYPLIFPFIHGDTEFNKAPEGYGEKLKQIIQVLKSHDEREDIQQS